MRILLFVSFIFTWDYAAAQSISVESFKLLENDLTANTYGTTERDQNGEIAALIKVVTLEKGFVFDGGMLGIVKTEQKAGEIWVYVPYGLQRITISHPDFGILRNYYFPVPIEKARTYELVLNTVREVSSTNYVDVVFENAMSTSDIYLNGIRIATGSWNGPIIAATYLVEVRQEDYVPYSTIVTLNSNENGRVINLPELEPMTGTVSITSQPADVTVYMDGVSVGTTPLTKDKVPIGNHKIELRKKNYRTAMTDVEVKYGETSSVNVEMIDEFKLTVRSDPSGASISINGDDKGQTPYSADMQSGDYLVRLSKPGYIPYKKQIHLGGDDLDISFTLERKILAANNVYAGGGYSIGYVSGFETYAGAYLGNVNIEAGYLIPQKTSSTVWWMDNPSSWSGQQGLEYEYCLAGAIAVQAGYGILFGNRTRVTPVIGAVYNRISGKYSGTETDMDQTSFVVSGRAGVRAEYSPIPHIALVCTPCYDIPFKKGDLASRIDATSDLIKNWCSGFSLSVGVELFF